MNTFTSRSAWIGDLEVREMTLKVDQEMIDLGPSESRVPDLDWTYTDRSGHWHAFADDGSHPTFSKHEHEIEDFEVECFICRICRQMITPHFKTTYNDEQVPGMKSWHVEAIMTKMPIPTPGIQSVIRIIEGDRVAFGIATVSAVEYRPGEAHVSMYGSGPLAYRQGHDT